MEMPPKIMQMLPEGRLVSRPSTKQGPESIDLAVKQTSGRQVCRSTKPPSRRSTATRWPCCGEGDIGGCTSISYRSLAARPGGRHDSFTRLYSPEPWCRTRGTASMMLKVQQVSHEMLRGS